MIYSPASVRRVGMNWDHIGIIILRTCVLETEILSSDNNIVIPGIISASSKKLTQLPKPSLMKYP